MNLNQPIHPAKKNFTAVKSAVQTVQVQHPYPIQAMGGVNAVVTAVLGAVALMNVTVGQAAAAVEKALAKTIAITIPLLANLVGLGDVRTTIQKILARLT